MKEKKREMKVLTAFRRNTNESRNKERRKGASVKPIGLLSLRYHCEKLILITAGRLRKREKRYGKYCNVLPRTFSPTLLFIGSLLTKK